MMVLLQTQVYGHVFSLWLFNLAVKTAGQERTGGVTPSASGPAAFTECQGRLEAEMFAPPHPLSTEAGTN